VPDGRVIRWLENHPAGSLVRAEDVPLAVWDQLMKLGYLAQLPGSGYGYQLVTYMVIQPNGQTDQ
jgi:hypothetical protein